MTNNRKLCKNPGEASPTKGYYACLPSCYVPGKQFPCGFFMWRGDAPIVRISAHTVAHTLQAWTGKLVAQANNFEIQRSLKKRPNKLPQGEPVYMLVCVYRFPLKDICHCVIDLALSIVSISASLCKQFNRNVLRMLTSTASHNAAELWQQQGAMCAAGLALKITCQCNLGHS